MDNLRGNKSSSYKPSMGSESHLADAASDLLHEGKKMANDMYESGKTRVSEMQDNLKDYSDTVIHKIHEKPLTSLLIAAGVGFVISSLFRR